MTIHIGAQPGEIAETVLMPVDFDCKQPEGRTQWGGLIRAPRTLKKMHFFGPWLFS